jgi:hypothetical protein
VLKTFDQKVKVVAAVDDVDGKKVQLIIFDENESTDMAQKQDALPVEVNNEYG